uniref:Uncharacterized protein n=1 Tax=Megaviridae environmental sample TaxID=1737588 RepID=A0A5J6VIQ6_9VIRU|nr:MAG: hypothetical protein [Megaviridae environmental sample]
METPQTYDEIVKQTLDFMLPMQAHEAVEYCYLIDSNTHTKDQALAVYEFTAIVLAGATRDGVISEHEMRERINHIQTTMCVKFPGFDSDMNEEEEEGSAVEDV